MQENADPIHVLGRTADGGPIAELGAFLARDGSSGARVGLDLDSPHVGLLTGKRGSGKSYTLGVLAEELASTTGLTGIVVDPMGVFGGLSDGTPATVIDTPRVEAGAIPPRGWCELLDLDPATGPGALLWRSADTADSLSGMQEAVTHSNADRATRRAVLNHLALAEQWQVFDPDGLDARTLLDAPLTVIDASKMTDSALGAITAAIARQLYETAATTRLERLPWLLIDEAHTVIDGVAGPALRAILTRGRHPGVSLVLATQRPSALPAVAISQADLLLSHRLTSTADIEALAAARPTYVDGTIADRIPDGVGEAIVVDDATESVVTIRVRERTTPHGGGSPRVSDLNGSSNSLFTAHEELMG